MSVELEKCGRISAQTKRSAPFSLKADRWSQASGGVYHCRTGEALLADGVLKKVVGAPCVNLY
ncbi:MAG: hypothetical protein M5R36_11515, partial [Deltaproteobacteria bacterium]|nr:hypothetical protein [Deltaproteobacteria bacterium]